MFKKSGGQQRGNLRKKDKDEKDENSTATVSEHNNNSNNNNNNNIENNAKDQNAATNQENSQKKSFNTNSMEQEEPEQDTSEYVRKTITKNKKDSKFKRMDVSKSIGTTKDNKTTKSTTTTLSFAEEVKKKITIYANETIIFKKTQKKKELQGNEEDKKKKKTRKFLRTSVEAFPKIEEQSEMKKDSNVATTNGGNSSALSSTYTPEFLAQLRKNSSFFPSANSKSKNTSGSKDASENGNGKDEDQPVIVTDEKILEELESKEPILNTVEIEKIQEEQEEEDEEFKRWEIDQIKKGASRKTLKQQNIRFNENNANSSFSLVTQKLPINTLVSPKVSVEDVLKKMKNSLQILEENQQQKKNEMQKNEEKIQDAEKTLVEMQTQQKETQKQYAYYQKLKGFVLDLCDCLAEKVEVF